MDQHARMMKALAVHSTVLASRELTNVVHVRLGVACLGGGLALRRHLRRRGTRGHAGGAGHGKSGIQKFTSFHGVTPVLEKRTRFDRSSIQVAAAAKTANPPAATAASRPDTLGAISLRLSTLAKARTAPAPNPQAVAVNNGRYSQ
jgi:hypothetical protein